MVSSTLHIDDPDCLTLSRGGPEVLPVEEGWCVTAAAMSKGNSGEIEMSSLNRPGERSWEAPPVAHLDPAGETARAPGLDVERIGNDAVEDSEIASFDAGVWVIAFPPGGVRMQRFGDDDVALAPRRVEVDPELLFGGTRFELRW